MRNDSHETEIATLARFVNLWRRQNGWSRETVADHIVKAHEAICGPAATGIRFEPQTTDSYDRMKVNADRIFRWLDDQTKDNNLMPANFRNSILVALPADLRMQCLTDMLRPIGCSVRILCAEPKTEFQPMRSLRTLMKEHGEAQQAVAALVDGATFAELVDAQKELGEAIVADKQTLAEIEAELARRDA